MDHWSQIPGLGAHPGSSGVQISTLYETHDVAPATPVEQAVVVNSHPSLDVDPSEDLDLTGNSLYGDSASSREDGQLSDNSDTMSKSIDSLGRSRKRKAASPILNHRPVKGLHTSSTMQQHGNGIANMDNVTRSVLNMISTLLDHGYPSQNLVQDIYGLILAQQLQNIPKAPVNSSSHVGAQLGTTPNVITKPESTSSANRSNAVAAKPASRDPEAYRARLEALRKAKNPAFAEDSALKRPATSTTSQIKPAGLATGALVSKTQAIKRAVAKVDSEKLRMKLAALKAENARRAQADALAIAQSDAASATQVGDSRTDMTVPRPSDLSQYRRTPIPDLTNRIDRQSSSSLPHSRAFGSPMGVDEEASMIFEASSSESSDDEEQTGNSLEALQSDIERMRAQIAARELGNRKQTKSVIPQALIEASIALSASESVDAGFDAINSPGSMRSPSKAYNDAADTAQPASNTHVSVTASKTDFDKEFDLQESDEVSDRDSNAGSASMSIDSGSSPGVVPLDNSAEADDSVSMSIDDDASMDGPSEGEIDDSISMSIDSGDSPALSEDDEEDGDASDEEVAMSIDSGEHPSAKALATSDIDSDASDGQSSKNEALSSSESSAVFAAGDEDSDASEAPAEEDEEYSPPNSDVAGHLSMVSDEVDSPSRDESASRSGSHTPDEGWRKFPNAVISSGVRIHNESGAKPTEQESTTETPASTATFVPYKSKIRFQSDILINPFDQDG